MEEVMPKMARRRGSDAGQSRRRWVRSCGGCPQHGGTNVSPPQRGAVRSPPLFSRDGPKWRDNYPEGPDHPVAPNRLETV